MRGKGLCAEPVAAAAVVVVVVVVAAAVVFVPAAAVARPGVAGCVGLSEPPGC